MKRIVETDEKGFEAALGQEIQVWGMVYIYAGKLVGVNSDHIELENPRVVYETGPLTGKTYQDAQPTLGPLRIMKAAIESWGPGRV